MTSPNPIGEGAREIATCPLCGTDHRADASDTGGSWKQIRIDTGYCNICAIGEERARLYAEGKGTRWLIAGGHYHSPCDVVPLGEADPRPNAPYWDRGCGGARWDFQFDGKPPQTCYSMWHGGSVSPHMVDRMPDNGRILTVEQVRSLLASTQVTK